MKLFEAAMGPTQMRLYSGTNFYAEECDKCREAGAFFSACLMISSAVESLLALLCLQSQKEVEKSKDFGDFPTAKTYEGKILKATFEQYIKLAAHLTGFHHLVWTQKYSRLRPRTFRLLQARCTQWTQKKDPEKILAFGQNPGIEMP